MAEKGIDPYFMVLSSPNLKMGRNSTPHGSPSCQSAKAMGNESTK